MLPREKNYWIFVLRSQKDNYACKFKVVHRLRVLTRTVGRQTKVALNVAVCSSFHIVIKNSKTSPEPSLPNMTDNT